MCVEPGLSYLQVSWSGGTNINELSYRCLQSKQKVYPGLEAGGQALCLSKNLNRVGSQSPRKDVTAIHKNKWNRLSTNLFPNREMETCYAQEGLLQALM